MNHPMAVVTGAESFLRRVRLMDTRHVTAPGPSSVSASEVVGDPLTEPLVDLTEFTLL